MQTLFKRHHRKQKVSSRLYKQQISLISRSWSRTHPLLQCFTGVFILVLWQNGLAPEETRAVLTSRNQSSNVLFCCTVVVKSSTAVMLQQWKCSYCAAQRESEGVYVFLCGEMNIWMVMLTHKTVCEKVSVTVVLKYSHPHAEVCVCLLSCWSENGDMVKKHHIFETNYSYPLPNLR